MSPTPAVSRLVVFLSALLAPQAWAVPPAAPPPPAEYDVELRYRIRAAGQRPQLFAEMLDALGRAGFRTDEINEADAESPTAERLVGTVAGSDARNLKLVPFVQTVLLRPRGITPPAEPGARVKVLLELSAGLERTTQRTLWELVTQRLRGVGFLEAVGYDHRNFSLLRGTIPADEVRTLLKDLRGEPGGWLLAERPDVPSLFTRNVAVRLAEVTPEPSDAPPPQSQAAAPPAPQAGQEILLKFDAELRFLLANEERRKAPLRVELVMFRSPGERDRSWAQEILQVAPGASIEARAGGIVTVLLLTADLAERLAQLPFVSAVRLPRDAGPAVAPPAGGAAAPVAPDVLRSRAGLERLHRAGRTGDGVRVALIATDFGGYRPLVGTRLPPRTRFFDLTAERTPALVGDPTADGVGGGTRCALALALAAPDADLLLIRVAPDSPAQVLDVARRVRGESESSESLRNRAAELAAFRERLDNLGAALDARRRALLDAFGTDPNVAETREKYEADAAAYRDSRLELTRRSVRYEDLVEGLGLLAGAQVVVNTLTWDDGLPGDGGSRLSRYLDEQFGWYQARLQLNHSRRPPPALWVQSAGDSGASAWAGPFRDEDGNGVLEFAPPGRDLPAGRWTNELNFLGVASPGALPTAELPAGARVRVSVNWREAHDPTVADRPEDFYRRSLADLRLVVLLQRDPRGERLPADDLDLIARSVTLPVRLEQLPNAGTFEQTVVFTAPVAGRYALRVEGKLPGSLRPAGVATLPAQSTRGELRLRLSARALDPAQLGGGRLELLDNAVGLRGGVGVPADARVALTVGPADADGRPRVYSPRGRSAWDELSTKPELVAFDQVELPGGAAGGPGVAAAVAGGTAASAISAGAAYPMLRQSLGLRYGELLAVPARWLDEWERMRRR